MASLIRNAPAFEPRYAAYLLAANGCSVGRGDIVVAVVDPGVGMSRPALVLLADGRWYVGPDNGLLALVARRAQCAGTWELTWRPGLISNTFHRRDIVWRQHQGNKLV